MSDLTEMIEAEKRIREALAAGPTPGPWHHCQPFQSVRAERTIHGPVPAQRVDFVSTKAQPMHERIIIPMAGEEAHVRSEDMAFIAACNPTNIAALLAEIDRLTRERDALLATVNNDLQMKTEVALRFELEQLQAKLAEARAERDALAKALAELVACKALKDAGLRSPEDEDAYFRRKPAAWAAARAALAQIEQERRDG